MAVPRLKQRYRDEIQAKLQEEFGYASVMQVPRVTRVVVNVGLGEALGNARVLDTVAAEVGQITGQRPVITRARKSIANFKLREGNPVGVTVTLRGDRMWEFLDRTINAALPRIRDFQGLSRTAFDGRGNYSIGLREQIVFPEIEFSTVDRIRGLQINVLTSAQNDAEARRLLELLGMPFARSNN
ncbi:MAG: 50S ribosomal protein L5 [Chloroflexota bacterium]|nr:50S ribosomal protein L5 [Chloroflexota bacterium]MDE2640828.1 50S ribosomal protein L5 [Chloroflexota bacterium]MXY79420.1 50S ribosomal protein L5 [Chloroflexota bacterium]